MTTTVTTTVIFAVFNCPAQKVKRDIVS